MHPHLLDIEGAARMMKHSASTARRLAAAGQIPATRIGGQWRLYAPALLACVIGAEAAAHARPALPDGWQEPEIVTSAELAELLGLSERSIAILLNTGQIPGNKVGSYRAYWPSILAKIAEGRPLVDDPDNPAAAPEASEECL